MISLFKRKVKSYGSIVPISVDMHSHLLPNIDDGVQSFEQSIHIIKKMIGLGYKKLIITPHIMGDFFKNTPEIIFDKLDKLKDIVKTEGLEIELEAAAEYYLDESFVERLEKEEKLLSFGDNYVLFETSYMNASPYLDHVVFMLKSQGYKPVLAHPERYVYLFDNHKKLFDLHEKDVLLQVNINSLAGYYSKSSQKIAEMLIDKRMVSFLGSDCHGEKHFKVTQDAQKLPHYIKALEYGVRNNKLL